MRFESFRKLCLSLPGATEDVQWENDLLFRVRGKIFASYNLEPPHGITLKATPEHGAELLEIYGIERAAYVGRYGWVTLRNFNVVADREMRDLVRESYDLVAPKALRKTNPSKPKPRQKPAGRKSKG